MNAPRTVVLLGLTAGSLLWAQPAPEKIQVTKTETAEFPTGGLLRMKNAVGELTITGWDQPGLEMTIIKSTKTAVGAKDRDQANKLLENVKITTERKGDELTISTAFPKHSKLARPFVGLTDFDLEYRIRVPRVARVDVEELTGEVHMRTSPAIFAPSRDWARSPCACRRGCTRSMPEASWGR